MKNLANCRPTEFLKQTNRVRKVAEKWLKDTDILNIRKNGPVYPEDATPEEKERLMQEQVKKNLSKMLDAILESNSEETLALLALLCFVEPENVDDHEMSEYIEALSELISNKGVLSFFTSLVRLGQTNTFGA